MLTVWGRKTSSNVQALMWCIGELGLPYNRIDAGHRYGVIGTDEFLGMNPNGTVPVLKDGAGPPIWETGAILRYLCNKYGINPFWPDDLEDRTRVDQWAEWAKLNATAKFTAPVFWRVVRTAPSERDETAINSAMAILTERLAIVEAQLSRNTFLAGEAFSIADVQLGHILFRYFDIQIDHHFFPSLERYYRNLTQRPAYQDHVMVSYEELRVID